MGEAETSGEYEPYGGGDNTSGDQSDHKLPDAMVMQASACKNTMADPRQVEAWFAETELWLMETIDFPWWPQLLPLVGGWEKVADENARKLAHHLVVSWRWAKQHSGLEAAPSATDISPGPILR